MIAKVKMDRIRQLYRRHHTQDPVWLLRLRPHPDPPHISPKSKENSSFASLLWAASESSMKSSSWALMSSKPKPIPRRAALKGLSSLVYAPLLSPPQPNDLGNFRINQSRSDSTFSQESICSKDPGCSKELVHWKLATNDKMEAKTNSSAVCLGSHKDLIIPLSIYYAIACRSHPKRRPSNDGNMSTEVQVPDNLDARPLEIIGRAATLERKGNQTEPLCKRGSNQNSPSGSCSLAAVQSHSPNHRKMLAANHIPFQEIQVLPLWNKLQLLFLEIQDSWAQSGHVKGWQVKPK